jgi:hypothetical protein
VEALDISENSQSFFLAAFELFGTAW